MASQEEIVIRHATAEDVPTLLALIQELADYEKESSAVAATPKSLLATLSFATSPTTPQTLLPITPTRPARALLAFTANGEAAGMALYYYSYSTWRACAGIYLEDLFVRETVRGKGVGGRFLGLLAKEVKSMGGERLEWSVLKWNEPSIRFYEGKSVGAKAMDGWQVMRVEGEGLERLAEKGR